MLASLGSIFLGAPLVVTLPKLVHDAYGTGVWLLGAFATTSAPGSILAVLIVGPLKQIRWRGIKAYLVMIAVGLAFIIIGVSFPRASEPIVMLLAGVIMGFGLGFFNVIWFTVLHQLIPSDKLGRVSSIDMMGSLALTPVGYVFGGIATDHFGPRLVFIGCGIISTLLPAVALLVRGIRQLD